MKNILLIVFSFIVLNGFSQKPGIYWIQFTDKANSPYSISSPSLFLSQRAIDRRVIQGIQINTLDIPVNQTYVDSMINSGFDVFDESKWFNGVLATVTDSTILQILSGISFVQSYKYVRPLIAKKNKSKKEDLGTLSDYYNYGMGTDQILMLNGNYLHNQGYRGDGMLIALLDVGWIGTNSSPIFDSIFNNNRIISTRDFVTGKNDNTVYESGSHGTSVLSTIGVIANGSLVGTAPHASFTLLKSEDADGEYIFEEYTWVCAAEYADSLGADIISSSLGYTTFDDTTQNHTWNDIDGETSVASISATIAARKGILVCISAGNSGSQPWHKIGIPADADSILAVGAVDTLQQPASFTSVGPSADGRVKPDVAAMGKGTAVVDVGGNVVNGNGTSFSCPIIAGMSACLWQAFPNATNMQIREAIIKSASQYYNPDTLLGYGIPNFYAAFFILNGIAVHNMNKEQIINVYPSPFSSQLNVEFISEKSNNISIEIIDILGKTVYKTNKNIIPNDYNIIKINNINDLNSGIYFVKIQTQSGSYKKLVVKS
ncbi:MAG: peptidase S8 [Bacteroidetes bacterium CG_4_10_14_3_um_filter_31_20]|nr:MAG: peptidase S8 [Bacteroidetes bacterium CG_4_10_14_3_um_filter_31_20]